MFNVQNYWQSNTQIDIMLIMLNSAGHHEFFDERTP